MTHPPAQINCVSLKNKFMIYPSRGRSRRNVVGTEVQQPMSLVNKSIKPRGWKKGQSGNSKGRPKGAKDKISRVVARRVLEAAVRDVAGAAADRAAKSLTPLGFMESVLRTPSQYPFAARAWAAEHAAPYLHRKMPIAIEGGDKDKPIRTQAEILFYLPKNKREKV